MTILTPKSYCYDLLCHTVHRDTLDGRETTPIVNVMVLLRTLFEFPYFDSVQQLLPMYPIFLYCNHSTATATTTATATAPASIPRLTPPYSEGGEMTTKGENKGEQGSF